MIRFSHWPVVWLAVGLSACGSPKTPAPVGTGSAAVPREALSHLVERYWQESAQSQVLRDDTGQPLTIAPQALADSLALERRYLSDLVAIPRPGLSDDAGLTYDLFRRGRELRIEGYLYPRELLPIDGFDGMPAQFAKMAAGAGRARFVTAADYDNWLRRCTEFGAWTRQAIANLRDGARRGYLLPQVVVRRALPLLDELGRDGADNVFYRAAATMPKSIADVDRARLAPALKQAVEGTVLPAYRELNEFLKTEYLPRARLSIGLAALPLGDRWYGHLIRRDAGSTLNPDEIHALGAAEVDKLRARMQALLAEVGFTGTATAYLESIGQESQLVYRTPEELIAAYKDLDTRTAEAAATLFSLQPTADFDIRPATLPLTLRDAPLWYRPAAVSGGGHGVLYVDTSDMADRPKIVQGSAFLREGVPGRQYQIELQDERSALPSFRRFGRDNAFEAAWAQYAASLGEDLGDYRDPPSRAQWLAQQLGCAASLVVDTGIHAQGWTRQQALDYWQAQVPASEAARTAAVDRMIAEPARAMACELGVLALHALRAHAEQALGSRFDPKAFHAAILEDGPMPLDVLDAKIKRWIKSVP